MDSQTSQLTVADLHERNLDGADATEHSAEPELVSSDWISNCAFTPVSMTYEVRNGRRQSSRKEFMALICTLAGVIAKHALRVASGHDQALRDRGIGWCSESFVGL